MFHGVRMRRNKLKRVKSNSSKEGHHHYHVQPAATVLSSGSSSYDEISQGKAADGKERENYSKGFKIAPIFRLSPNQNRKNKGGSDGGTEQKPIPSSPSGDGESPHAGYHPKGNSGPGVSSCWTKWRGQSSSAESESCSKEIQRSSPAFPVSTVYSTLSNKACQQSQDSRPADPDSLQQLLKEKKRRGTEVSERQSKRSRSDTSAEAVVGHCPPSGQDEKKRPRGHKPIDFSQSCRSEASENFCHKNPGWTNHTTPVTEPIKGSDEVQGDSCLEDVLWTDKYVPQHSSEVIGNSASVNKSHSWLRNWKRTADREERREMEEKKQEKSNSWDCGDFQGEAGLDDGRKEPSAKAMSLTGPSGVGKTAAVYACAQELGFKVFEVNCSSQRSGRHVYSQLKETTQSHLVDVPGDDPSKPAYFNNYTTNSFTPKPEGLPGKLQLSKNLISKSKNRAATNSSRRKSKAKPGAGTLARYFKMKGKSDHVDISTVGNPKTEEVENSSAGCYQTVAHVKKTATSLILFEEVDVRFEDDVGFSSAIKAFMATTKRPVVSTTTDPLFKERFDCNLDEIIFKIPSAMNVCSYSQSVCLAENFRSPSDDASSLYRLTHGDVRRCSSQSQFWVNGSRRWTAEDGPISSHYQSATGGGGLDSKCPPSEAGCAAHMLGLHPVTPSYLLNFLKHGSCSGIEMSKFSKLSSESWRSGVPLSYCNSELLLSIGAVKSDSQSQTEPKYPSADLQILPPNRTISSETLKTCIKSSRLSRRRFAASRSDAQSASHLTTKHQRASSFTETQSKAPSSHGKPEECALKAVTDCLDGSADFFDLMSRVDAALPHYISGPRTAEAFVWTGASLSDGLLDEPGEEDSRSWEQGRLSEMKAAAEGLGCRRCWWRVTEAWTEAYECKQRSDVKQWNRSQERSMLTTCSKRQNLSFTAQPPCVSSVPQRRSRSSRMVLSSKSFSSSGNRRAVCIDYSPVLSFICHTLTAQQHKGESGRCWNYSSCMHSGLSKSAIQLSAEDFTSTKVQKDF